MGNIDFYNILSGVGIAVFSLLAITNPFGNLPVFISMSDDLSRAARDRLFRAVVLTAAVIVIIFTLIGTVIMEKFFQVNLAELRVAGGVLLMVMGTKNLLAPQEIKEHATPQDNVNETEQVHKRIIPMAFPMLVGPGTLSTVIILNNESGMIITFIAIFAAFGLILLLFSSTHLIEKLLGKLALFVTSRIMQVFIMAIGAKMLIVGLRAVFPVLGGG